jgi:hypothetical protein
MAASLVHALFGHELGEYAVGLVGQEAKLGLLARLAPADLAGILSSGQQQAQLMLEAVWWQHSGSGEQAQPDCREQADAAPWARSGRGVDAGARADGVAGQQQPPAAAADQLEVGTSPLPSLRSAAKVRSDMLVPGCSSEQRLDSAAWPADQQRQQRLAAQQERSGMATVAAVVAAAMPGDGEDDDLVEMLSLLGV